MLGATSEKARLPRFGLVPGTKSCSEIENTVLLHFCALLH